MGLKKVTLRPAALKTYFSHVYGVRWDAANDVMVKGMLVNGSFMETAYTAYPVQEEMVRVLRDAVTGAEQELHPDDSGLLADGSAATLDGSAGDVQVRIPKHYQLWHRDGDYQYILVPKLPFSFRGMMAWVPLCFGGQEYYYVDAFRGVLWSESAGACVDGQDISYGAADKAADVLRSLPGYKPWVMESRGDFRQLFANRGGATHQQIWDSHQALKVALFLTEFGTWDSQAAIPGYTGAGSWDYAKVRTTGRTLPLGNASGSILVDLAGADSDLDGLVSSDQIVANSFRGIEDPFGGVWEFLDGINVDNTDGSCHVYTCTDPDNLADDVDDTADGYIDTGHAPGFGDDNNYITDILGAGKHCPLYPSAISGGSSATFLCDYHYNSQGGWRVLLVGGYLSAGGNAGLVYLAAGYGSGGRYSTVGSRGAANFFNPEGE